MTVYVLNTKDNNIDIFVWSDKTNYSQRFAARLMDDKEIEDGIKPKGKPIRKIKTYDLRVLDFDNF